MNNENYMSVESALEYLGNISRTALWKMTKRGLKRYKFGKRVLFKREDIDEFLQCYVVKDGDVKS